MACPPALLTTTAPSAGVPSGVRTKPSSTMGNESSTCSIRAASASRSTGGAPCADDERPRRRAAMEAIETSSIQREETRLRTFRKALMINDPFVARPRGAPSALDRSGVDDDRELTGRLIPEIVGGRAVHEGRAAGEEAPRRRHA